MQEKNKPQKEFSELRELYQLLGQAHVKRLWKCAQAISELIEDKRKQGVIG